MKKIKFLSFAVMAAFMALGLTSCEKEDFRTNLKVDIDAPAAVVSIQPNVIAFVNGVAKNVTDVATVNFTTPTANEEGKIAKQDVTITVSYTATDDVFGLSTELTGNVTVSVPNLERGMTCTLTPTIILTAQTNGTNLNPVGGTTTNYTIEPKDIPVKNYNKYYYTDVTAKYEAKEGTEVSDIRWENTSYAYDPEIAAAIEEFNDVETVTKKLENIEVLGESQTIITVEFIATQTTYSISKTVSLEARSSKEVKVVEFDVITYDGENVTYEYNIHLQGKSHGHGHIGHSHGHDNSANAGGGIVIGD